MVQTPAPPMPPMPPGLDLNFLLNQAMPIVALIVVFLGLRWVFRTPVGEALAERIRTSMRGGSRWEGGETGEDPQRVAGLEEPVCQLQMELAEFAELLDFAERILGGSAVDTFGLPQRARADRPAAARYVEQAPRENGQAQRIAAPAQRSDRGIQAQEEHPDRAPEACRGAQAHSENDVVDRQQERVRDVREDGGADRARRAQAHRGGRGERGSVGRHAAQAVPVDRSEGRRGSAAARLEAQAGAPAGGLPGRGEAPRKGRGRGGAG